MLKSIVYGAVLIVGLAGCNAPQGTKLASNEVLAPVATGPATGAAALGLQNSGEFVNLAANGTITVQLPARGRNGIEWRLSETPDPSVLQLVTNRTTPAVSEAQIGEQTMVFQATGPGDVRVRMWYGTLWASPMDARVYEFTASVSAEPEKPARKSKKKS